MDFEEISDCCLATLWRGNFKERGEKFKANHLFLEDHLIGKTADFEFWQGQHTWTHLWRCAWLDIQAVTRERWKDPAHELGTDYTTNSSVQAAYNFKHSTDNSFRGFQHNLAHRAMLTLCKNSTRLECVINDHGFKVYQQTDILVIRRGQPAFSNLSSNFIHQLHCISNSYNFTRSATVILNSVVFTKILIHDMPGHVLKLRLPPKRRRKTIFKFWCIQVGSTANIPSGTFQIAEERHQKIYITEEVFGGALLKALCQFPVGSDKIGEPI